MNPQKPKNTPFIIPVFIPQAGCPHQCIYCDQSAITRTPQTPLTPQSLKEAVFSFLPFRQPHRSPTQIAFYGGNFLGLEEKYLLSLLETTAEIIACNHADAIRFSTRPDTVTKEYLDLLSPFPVSTIELGVQSMKDPVLKRSNRGHTAADTTNAVALLKEKGYEIGLQMMTGLPKDDDAGAIETTERIIHLAPDFVRIYPTIVLKKSPLARMYQQGRYTPPDLDHCVELAADLYRRFTRRKIPVIRMGLQASDGFETETVLAGPYHPAFGHLVISRFFFHAAADLLEQKERGEQETRKETSITLKVHPSSIPRMRGHKNENIGRLKERFGLLEVRVISDDHLSQMAVAVA